jgi:O-antigen ligase
MNSIVAWKQKYQNVGRIAVITFIGLLICIVSFRVPLIGFLIIFLIVVLIIVGYIFFRHGTLSYKHVVTPFLITSILFPSIKILGAIPNVRPELILLFVLGTLFLLKILLTGKTKIRWRRNSTNRWFLFFFLAINSSIIYAALFLSYLPIGRDFMELVKFLKFFLIFAIIANLDISATDLKRYYLVALFCFLISAFVGFAQFWNLLNINEIISPYYAPTQMIGLQVHKRITGTTSNPNEFGMLMIFASSLAFSGVLFIRKSRFQPYFWTCLAVFSLAIALTLSRTSYISLVASLSFMLLLKYPQSMTVKRYVGNMVKIIPILIVVIFIIILLSPEKIFIRLETLQNFQTNASFVGRLGNWNENFVFIKSSPVFGWGPGKATMVTVVDGEWILLLRRYGIFGVVIFILWFVSFYRGLSALYQSSFSMETKALTIALQAILVSCIVYMIAANIYHALQIMPILCILLGLAYSQVKKSTND